MRLSRWLCSFLFLAASASPAPQTQNPSPPADKPPQDRRSRPGRPKTSAGRPTESSVSAGRRGSGCNAANASAPLQVALIRPFERAAETSEEQPRLYWYVSGPLPKGCEARFTLTCDPRDNRPAGCGDAAGSNTAVLEAPASAGLWLIETAALAGATGPVKLTPGLLYRWYISVGRPEGPRSEDDVAGWWVRRVDRGTPAPWYDAFASAFSRSDDAQYLRILNEAHFEAEDERR